MKYGNCKNKKLEIEKLSHEIPVKKQKSKCDCFSKKSDQNKKRVFKEKIEEKKAELEKLRWERKIKFKDMREALVLVNEGGILARREMTVSGLMVLKRVNQKKNEMVSGKKGAPKNIKLKMVPLVKSLSADNLFVRT